MTNPLRLAPELTMSGAVPLFHLFVILVCKRTTLPSLYLTGCEFMNLVMVKWTTFVTMVPWTAVLPSINYQPLTGSKSALVRYTKAYGGVEIYPHSFYTRPYVEVSVNLTQRPLRFRERVPGSRWIGGWLDVLKNRKTFVTKPTAQSPAVNLM
jgi:hypothetical protein